MTFLLGSTFHFWAIPEICAIKNRKCWATPMSTYHWAESMPQSEQIGWCLHDVHMSWVFKGTRGLSIRITQQLWECQAGYMGFSWVMGVPPIILFNGFFPHMPSILGIPPFSGHLMKHLHIVWLGWWMIQLSYDGSTSKLINDGTTFHQFHQELHK